MVIHAHIVEDMTRDLSLALIDAFDIPAALFSYCHELMHSRFVTLLVHPDVVQAARAFVQQRWCSSI